MILFASSARALVLQHDASKDRMATTTSFLVDFDGPKSSELTVSAGAVGGTDGMGSSWGHTATTCADVTAASGITGISFRISTHSQNTFIGMATTNHSDSDPTSHRYYNFAVNMRDNLNADVYTYDRFPNHTYNFVTIRGRHTTSPAEDDLWSIEVNAQNKVEFKKNGVAYYTTTTDVTYPWHVVVDLYDLQTGAATAVHDLSYIGGVPAVTIPSIACGTDWPTPAPAQAPASATGDPHLQNVHGERFDLMVAGRHVLISIPRGERAENTLLLVQARARPLGGLCEEIYFTEVNVTGSWAYAKRAGGYHYDSQGDASETANWITLGRVEVKVVHAHTASGTKYLNVYVKHLGRAGFVVGGLLGEDDHEAVSTPPAGCAERVSLGHSRAQLLHSSDSLAVSAAEATF